MVVQCPEFKGEPHRVSTARFVSAFSNNPKGGRGRKNFTMSEVNPSDTAFNLGSLSSHFPQPRTLAMENADSLGESTALTAAVSAGVLPLRSAPSVPVPSVSTLPPSLSEKGAYIRLVKGALPTSHFSPARGVRGVRVLSDEQEKSYSQGHHLLLAWVLLLVDFALFLLILLFLAINVGVLALLVLIAMMIISLFGASHAWEALTYPGGSVALSILAVPPLVIHGALAFIIFLILWLISLAQE